MDDGEINPQKSLGWGNITGRKTAAVQCETAEEQPYNIGRKTKRICGLRALEESDSEKEEPRLQYEQLVKNLEADGQKCCAIILAAGSGSRLGAGCNKMFVPVGKISILERTLKSFAASRLFSMYYIVYRQEERQQVDEIAQKALEGLPYMLVQGGKERQDSVGNALKQISPQYTIIAVHDGARCFVRPQVIADCVRSAWKYGSGVAGTKAVDTLKQVEGGNILNTLEREHVVQIQTPQVFEASLLQRAYQSATKEHIAATDDAALVERLGVRPVWVEGGRDNIKITTLEDIRRGESSLNGAREYRVGQGYDVHAFQEGRKLVLGGVEIPGHRGLAGHSDADVLVHSVMDSLLGAAGYGDIGELFPDSDPAFFNISSLILLRQVGEAVQQRGEIVNIDATLVMQEPKIGAYKKTMGENISKALGISQQRVNIKATTTERLGFEGRKEGASAMSVCLMAVKSRD